MEVAENIYLSDRQSIDMAGMNMWKFPPGGTESVLMQLGNGNLRVVLFSEQPRAFSKGSGTVWLPLRTNYVQTRIELVVTKDPRKTQFKNIVSSPITAIPPLHS